MKKAMSVTAVATKDMTALSTPLRQVIMVAEVAIIMAEEKSSRVPIKIVASLPDLIRPEDYQSCTEQKKIRLRISIDENGVEILGDSLYVEPLEKLLAAGGATLLERSLCG